MRRVGRPTVRDEPRKLIAIRLDAKVLSWLRETAEKKRKPYQSLRASEYAGPDPQRYRDLADALRAGRLAGAAMDDCDPLPVSMSDPMLDAPRTVSAAAYGVANPGNVSPRRRHVSGKHFELFSRRTQSCRQPGRAQSFAPKVATEWCEAMTPHVFPKCINARPDPRLFSLVGASFNFSSSSCAIEVERTTSIYSGILRMADLLSLLPNIEISIHIVAPGSRRNEVFKQISRPVFAVMEKGPLAELCSYISYESVYELAKEKRLKYMTDSILDEYSAFAEE
jgi:hypothetical protein